MIKSKKKPRQQDVISNVLSKMRHTEKVKKRLYHEQDLQQQLKGYKEETKRIEKQKLKQKEQQKKKRMFYY